MDRQSIVLIVALLVALVAGMFIYAYLKRTDSTAITPIIVAEEKPPAAEEGAEIARIDAKHYFKESLTLHTIAGELLMPTPCDLLTTNTVLLDNGTRAVVSFDVINNAAGGLCAQSMTPNRFKAAFKAPRDIKIEAVYKGKKVPLNLIEAGPGEDPEDFDLFIKG